MTGRKAEALPNRLKLTACRRSLAGGVGLAKSESTGQSNSRPVLRFSQPIPKGGESHEHKNDNGLLEGGEILAG